MLLYDIFHRSAIRSPNATALEATDGVVTYAELDELATRIADGVAKKIGARRIGLATSRRTATYAAYLGINRIGKTVVPMSIEHPPARLFAMCAAAGIETVVHHSTIPVRLWSDERAQGIEWLYLDDLLSDDVRGATADQNNDLSYILFTSGSTGVPKGVPIVNSQLETYLEYCVGAYGLNSSSRTSQTFDLTFDPSIFDLFVTWKAGGTVVVPTKEDIALPADFVNSRSITHWFSVPSVISIAHRMGGIRPDSMPSLAWSMFAGEQLTLADAEKWKAAAPASKIVNLYGPTELTVTCASYELPARVEAWPRTSNSTVPIGKVYPHLEAALIDGGRLVAGRGELCVRGCQRFDGYLDASCNRGQFIRMNPSLETHILGEDVGEQDWYRTGDLVRRENAVFVHFGRVDNQVKVAGYRIELNEVESILRMHPSVDSAVVLVRKTHGLAELVAVIVSVAQVEDRDLSDLVSAWLPKHMLPRTYIRVDELPLGPNSKVDRQLLQSLVERTR